MESPESTRQKPRLSKCREMGGLQEWKHHDDVRHLPIWNFFLQLTLFHCAFQIDTPLYNMAAGLCLGAHGVDDLANAVLLEDAPIVMTLCRENTAAKWDLVKL